MGSISEPRTFIIVGAGVFGSSTALHLSRGYPLSRITLIDRTPFPNPSAAGHDLNKIIRADYPDRLYMKLALEAQHQWRSDPTYQRYYHETGMLFAENLGMGRAALSNYKTLLGEEACPAVLLHPDEARQRFNGIFADAEWTGVRENFYNPESGWGEADKVLQEVIQIAVKQGVIYRDEGVSQVLIDDETGICLGVELDRNGERLFADQIILCSGAHTAELIANSAPHNKDLQVRGRMIAAAAVSCYARIPEARRHRFRDAPVMFNGLDHTHGESIPLTPDGVLKFNFELSFTNLVDHPKSGQKISVVPTRLSQTTWSQSIPQQLKDEVRMVMNNTYGKELDGIEVENYRMCWDAVTPNQDWIISPHPHCSNLYIAGGGSFHAWKFLPNIGKYVVEMLHGELDAELSQKWAWDRVDEGAACEMYIPTRDLKDLYGYTG